MKYSLGISPVFLRRSLVFPILLFSISLHCSLKKAFSSLLAILWNSAFKWVFLSFSPLLFASLLFTAICTASPDNHFSFLNFSLLGMVLIPVSCTVSRMYSAAQPLHLYFKSMFFFFHKFMDLYKISCAYLQLISVLISSPWQPLLFSVSIDWRFLNISY